MIFLAEPPITCVSVPLGVDPPNRFALSKRLQWAQCVFAVRDSASLPSCRFMFGPNNVSLRGI